MFSRHLLRSALRRDPQLLWYPLRLSNSVWIWERRRVPLVAFEFQWFVCIWVKFRFKSNPSQKLWNAKCLVVLHSLRILVVLGIRSLVIYNGDIPDLLSESESCDSHCFLRPGLNLNILYLLTFIGRSICRVDTCQNSMQWAYCTYNVKVSDRRLRPRAHLRENA